MTARVLGFLPIVGAIAGLIIWAAHFGLVYMATAIVCERNLAGRMVLEQPLIPVLVLGATALALVAVAIIGLRAWRRLEHSLAGQEGEDEPRFPAWLSLAITLLSALAIAWEAVPVLLMRPCG